MPKEYINRRDDDGCEVSPSCLICPLPECKYDNPVAFQVWKRGEDRKEKGAIALKMWEERIPLMQIGRELQMSARTVSRVIDEEKDRLATSNLTIH